MKTIAITFSIYVALWGAVCHFPAQVTQITQLTHNTILVWILAL